MSGLPNGIKVIKLCGAIMCINQYGGRETGSSYNFVPMADRNVISNVTTMFSDVAITMKHCPSCHFIDIYLKFSIVAMKPVAILNISIQFSKSTRFRQNYLNQNHVSWFPVAVMDFSATHYKNFHGQPSHIQEKSIDRFTLFRKFQK